MTAPHEARRRAFPLFTVYASLLTLLLLPLSAHAFPSWMGVYGSFERHNGVNPGSFVILMNQDYWGLHAEVVIRVNGGSWTAHTMNYSGNHDGNSLWTHHHSVAFPTNATVEFYFHGWDNWGGNIWDSNGGNNYSFQAGLPALDWIGNTHHFPTNGVLKAGHDLWMNTFTWPRDAASNVTVGFSVNGGSWDVGPMSWRSVSGNDDWWHRYMGRFSAGTEIEYFVDARDYEGSYFIDNNSGNYYLAVVATGSVVQWIGNARHWPTNDALTSVSNLWLDIEASPTNTTVGGYGIFSINGYAWYENPLSFKQVLVSNDWWHSNLGTMPPHATVYYLFEIEDGQANWYVNPTSAIPLVAIVAGDGADTDDDNLPDDWEEYWWGNLEDGGPGNYSGDGVPGVPLTDHLAYIIGVDPTVSNQHANVPLMWFPDRPFRGGWVKLSFFISTNDPLHGGTIYARINQNDGQGAYNEELALFGERYETGVAISTNAGSHLQLTLHNSLGVTNNNFTLGWKVPLRDLGGEELADSDGDGLPDWWELLHGLDPLDDGSINPDNGADGDLSGDGITNLEVYLAGGNPYIFYPVPFIAITYPRNGATLP